MAQSKLPEDLEQRHHALAPADRLALATRLLASVEGPDPDRDETWSAELDRRDRHYECGTLIGPVGSSDSTSAALELPPLERVRARPKLVHHARLARPLLAGGDRAAVR